MKIKKNRLVILVISILLAIGYIALSIYQLFNGDFDPINLILLIFIGDSIVNCFEKDK